jgi:hypothetical protein
MMAYSIPAFTSLLVVPTLARMGTNIASDESCAMVVATAYVETRLGWDVEQQPGPGPAYGICQVECTASCTAQDVLRRHVVPTPALTQLWIFWTGYAPEDLLAPEVADTLSRVVRANHHCSIMLSRLRYLDYEPPMPALDAAWRQNAASYWANGYWRGADRPAGIEKFLDLIDRTTASQIKSSAQASLR